MRFENFSINKLKTNENQNESNCIVEENKEIDSELLEKATNIVLREITDPQNFNDNEIAIHNQLLKTCAMGDKNAQAQVKATIRKIILDYKIADVSQLDILVKKIYETNYGLGAIDDLFNDSSINEIWVNGYNNVWIQKNGISQKIDIQFKDDNDVIRVIQLMLNYNEKDITKQKPMAEARMLDGSRLTVFIPPVSDRPYINIRKFDAFEVSTNSLLETKTVNQEMVDWLTKIIKGRANILLIGETGSGKTSFLKWLAGLVNPNLRIGTIETNFELKLKDKYPDRNIFAYEEHPELGIDMGDLFIKCLRSSPDIIICGEARGSEADELIRAMRRGHPGSMSTIHTNSPETATDDLAEMISEDGKKRDPILLRNRISEALDIIIQIRRLENGQRKIVRISEVVNKNLDFQIVDIFKYNADLEEGKFEKINNISNKLKQKCYYYGVSKEDLKNM